MLIEMPFLLAYQVTFLPISPQDSKSFVLRNSGKMDDFLNDFFFS